MFTVNTDGGSKGNPGIAAIGVVIKDDSGKVVDTISKFIGVQTNNFAEYTALIEALQLCVSKNIKSVQCILDSELVVKQVNGQYKVKEETLKLKHAEILSLKSKFDYIKFMHVLRSQNKEADLLVNKALDNIR